MLEAKVNTRANSHGRELTPALLTLSEPAIRTFIEFCQWIENQCGPDRSLFGVKDFAQKAPENAARLAATMHHYSETQSSEIGQSHMAQAILLAEFFLAEALRLTQASQMGGPLYEAERVRVWLIDRWEHPAISVRHLVRLGPYCTRDSQSARRVIRILADHGWLVPIRGGTTIDGHRVREAWSVVPKSVG